MGENNERVNLNFFARMWQYSKERFPVASFLLLIGSYYAALVLTGGRYFGVLLSNVWFAAIASFVFIFIFFFHIRLFDEFKDYDDDKIARPERPLPRGLVSKKDLLICLVVALVVELAISYGISLLVPGVLAIAYSFLMFKEFWIGSYLKKHIMLYAYSHEILFLFFTAFALGTLIVPIYNAYLGAFALIYTLFSIFSFLNFELTRKLRLKEDENCHIETYSQVFGLKKASLIALLHVLLTLISACGVLSMLAYGRLTYVLVIALSGYPAYTLLGLIRSLDKVTLKSAENASVVYVLCLNVLMIIFSLFA